MLSENAAAFAGIGPQLGLVFVGIGNEYCVRACKGLNGLNAPLRLSCAAKDGRVSTTRHGVIGTNCSAEAEACVMVYVRPFSTM